MFAMLHTQPVSRLVLLVTLLTATVPVAILGVYVYQKAWEDSWREVHEKHQLLAQNLVQPISIYVRDHRELLALVAESIGVLREIDRGKTQPMLTRTLRRAHGFRTLVLIDLESRVQALAPTEALVLDHALPYTTEACYLDTRKSGRWSLSNIEPHPVTGRPSLFIGQPVHDAAGKMRAVLLGELDIAPIESVRSRVKFGRKGHSAIVDKRGHVIAHPNPAWMKEMKDLSHWKIVQRMMAGETGITTFYSSFMKENMVAGYASIPGIGWGIMVPQPESEIAERVRGLLKTHLLWGSLGLLVATLLGLRLARWITRPVEALAQSARDLMSADNSARLPQPGHDMPREIHDMRRAFARLIHRLQRSRHEVDLLNRTLQERVEDATRQLREANELLKEEATSDHLTDLANRRSFEVALTRTLRRKAPTHDFLCLMLIDVDNFKQINDQYGHPAGDAVLNHVARVLEGNMRGGDMVARYGGDEFIAYLRCDKEVGKARADDIRNSLEGYEIPWGEELLRITVSIGLCCKPLNNQTVLSDLISDADEALYRAKNSGRNRVELTVISA